MVAGIRQVAIDGQGADRAIAGGNSAVGQNRDRFADRAGAGQKAARTHVNPRPEAMLPSSSSVALATMVVPL